MDIKKKHITVLGSTGSVGAQALDVARFLGLKVDAIAFGSNGPNMPQSETRLPRNLSELPSGTPIQRFFPAGTASVK